MAGLYRGVAKELFILFGCFALVLIILVLLFGCTIHLHVAEKHYYGPSAEKALTSEDKKNDLIRIILEGADDVEQTEEQ